MELFEALNSRASAIRLTEPGPSREHIMRIIEAGARAPDHGKLGPWRFVIVEGPAREKLGQAMIDGLRARQPGATAAQCDRERDKVMRAPTIIAVAARVKKGHKIPEIEQTLAVGAATQNMFLAAHALGHGAMWKTGEAAYDPVVNTALGLQADDQIVAFLYLGKILIPGTARPPLVEDRVSWL